MLFVPAALMSVKEMAKGITYDDPIKTRWVSQHSSEVVLLKTSVHGG